MKRVVSLFLPTWPTDRLRRAMGAAAPPPEVPLVLLGQDGRRRVVCAADTAAQRLGLRPGMAATQAQALVAGLQIHDAEPAADKAALNRLAVWALRRYSPVVAADPPDGLVIDASGAAHLHGGEAAMLADLTRRLTAAGIQARAAMAGTLGAAHALARYRWSSPATRRGPRSADRGVARHGGARLQPRLRRANLQPDRGLRQLRLSGMDVAGPRGGLGRIQGE